MLHFAQLLVFIFNKVVYYFQSFLGTQIKQIQHSVTLLLPPNKNFSLLQLSVTSNGLPFILSFIKNY